jgi:hypothetical protein
VSADLRVLTKDKPLAFSIRAFWTRRRFAIFCAFLATVFVILTVIARYEPQRSFMFSLIFSFFAWLFLFHAVFGFANLVTAAQARAIDYVYLGVAAAGVFVLALNYEGKRADVTYSEKTELLTSAFDKASTDTFILMSRLDTATCGVGGAPKQFPAMCELVEMTDERAINRDQMQDKTKITVEEFLTRLPPFPTGQEEAFARVERAISSLTDARAKMLEAAEVLGEHKGQAKTRDVREESHGVFLWPFILAFAFALRLTRTTIEVFDWTVKPSPAQ